jgi:dTDP-4-dehydrorhamnose reductase
MASAHILVIGKIGQVGWELRRTLAPLGQLVCVDYPEVDLTDGNSIRHWVHEAKPAVIVNAAAYTAVDKAESDTDLAMKINGVAPGILAEEAKIIFSTAQRANPAWKTTRRIRWAPMGEPNSPGTRPFSR